MQIEPKVNGWTSMKNKLLDVIRVANKVSNSRIQRGGTTDSITFSGDSLVINIQDFPAVKTSEATTASGSGLNGIEIIWADQTITYIRASDMLAGYDPDPDGAGHLYWSLVLDVTNGLFDHDPPAFDGFTYDSTEAIFEDDGGDPAEQTKYRFRIITQGIDSEGDPANAAISVYGQYREMTIVIDGELYQTLIKTT